MKTGFLRFMKERQQVNCFMLFSIIAVVICVLMRVFYTFPFSYPDTGSYVLSAVTGSFNVYRPMGYSNYLRFLHCISDSIYFIFYVNYVLLFLSEMFLVFSVKYLAKINNTAVFILFGLLLLTNARLVFACNLLMSDGIFSIMSIVSFTLLLWLVYKPSYFIALVSMILMVLMCRVRYSGLFFIPVTALVYFLSFKEKNKYIHLLFTLLPLLTGVYFYSSTKQDFKNNTHVDSFSGFGGWQSINNASVLLPEAKQIPLSKFKSQQLKSLHSFIQSCPDDMFQDKYAMSTNYMWNNDLPYKIYNRYLLDHSSRDYQTQWAASGKLFGEYSKVLIKEYPFRYASKYVLPSIVSNFKFKAFEENSIDFENEPMYQQYYGLTEDKYTQSCKFFEIIEPIRKILQICLWIIMLASSVLFLLTTKKGALKDKTYILKLSMLLTLLVVLGGQSLSSPNTTWRYTLPLFAPMISFICCECDRLLGVLRIKNGAE